NGVTLQGYGIGLIHSDSNGVLTSSLINLNNATDVSGILPVQNGGSPFTEISNNAIVQRNTNEDLLLGSNATASAKFGFVNVGAGTPTASISGQNGALSLDA